MGKARARTEAGVTCRFFFAAFVPTAFKQTLAFEGFDVEVLEANMIHNVGCLFLAAPLPVYELVVALHAQNPQLKMMAKWLAAHRRCIASDVRRASSTCQAASAFSRTEASSARRASSLS